MLRMQRDGGLILGFLSVRNLKSIKRSRVVLWVILGFSSLPPHLLSVIYLTIQTNSKVMCCSF